MEGGEGNLAEKGASASGISSDVAVSRNTGAPRAGRGVSGPEAPGGGRPVCAPMLAQ